ncbi:uncharacterized protein LOC111046153 isoform X2 [Nilaparvata lugens]|uniref:uncharacterized protein LOC111046153 isoform X2 n=1 Tax=Nilaparvata lugens TaxID=108931 RepID=UPI00193E23B4|nr:uncharacterized protein LOC111046153 isoform X2 [Nilaparvata lugens]
MSNAQESPPNDGITADYVTIHNKLLNSIEKKIQKYDLTNAESFLTFWSETNDAVITYDYLLSSSVNPSVIFCVVALESPIVGKVFITDASATVKEIATRLASVKAVKYLLKANLITSEDVKSIDLDLPEYDSDVLDNLQKFMFASTNNKNRSNPVANSSLNQEKSVDCGKSMINRNENGKLEQNHIDKLVETRSSKSITLETFPEKDRESANNVMESQESSSSAVRPEKSQNLDSQENEKIVTENMQNIVLNGGDCNYSSFKDATSFLRNWCDRNNVVALSECAYIKAVSMKGFVCSLALSSSTGNLFLTESASLTEEGACLFASKKAVSYLVDNGKVTLDEIGHINLHVPKVEAVILRKLQNSQKAEQFEEQKIEEFVESPMSSDSEGTSDEDSDSDSNIRESRNAKAVCDDQNGGSDQEQNHIEEVDEMEAHAPISSEDILDKNADTTKFVLESQNESSEAVINGDSQEHSQEIPTQNSTMYPASKNQSNKKIVLSDWCRQNNIHLAVDFAPIQIGPSRIELCTVTLKWTTNDKSFSTGAVGNSSKMAERLATKKALIHLMSEGLVMPDEINRIDLNTNKSDKSTNEKVKQFLSDKANKAKSRLSFDLIHRLEESVSSFPIDQKNEKSQLEEWCSAHGLKMEISTSKIVEAIFECKVIVEPYDYVGSGKGKRCPSFRRACLDFINHLQEDDKPDKLEVTDDPIIVLREWCKDRELKLQHKSEKTDPAKHQSRVKVESFSFSGIGIGPDVQSAENLACRRFIDRLRAEKLFPKDETEECKQSEIVTEDVRKTTNSTSLVQRPPLLRDLVQRYCQNNYGLANNYGQESNKKSKQNEENTLDIAESRTSQPLPNEFPESIQCEDSGSDIDPLEEQVSSSEDGSDADLSERSQNSSQQQIDESFLAFKQEIIKNRSLGSGGEITSLHDWCQQNNVAFKLKYHFGPTTGTKRNVWFCALTLSSPTVGEFCSFSAPGSKRKACEPLVTKFAFNYLVQEEFIIRDQIKSHKIDVSPMEARVLKKLEFTPHIKSRYYKKGSKIDFKLQENKKKTSASRVSYKPAKSNPTAELEDWCMKNGLTVKYEWLVLNGKEYLYQVKVPPHEYIGTGNGSNSVAKQRACQDFINHLPKECKRQVLSDKIVRSASKALSDWCSKQGLEMDCKRRKTVPRKYEFVVRVQSFDFVGTGIERKKRYAREIAAQDFLDRLMAEGIRKESDEAVNDGCDSDVEFREEKDETEECAQHEKLSEAADESRTSTPLSQCCSENVTCEDSGSSIVFMDEDEEESNKKSEQNEENTMDVAESRTSLPLPNEFPESTQCEDSGSDIDPLEEQVSSSEDGLDADLPERSQNSPQQQIDESFLAFKQEIIKNRSLGSGGEITSLHDWCQQNNVAFKLKYHFGPTTGTKRNVWFCALTLSSPTVGEFCSFSAPGSKRKACEPLVTKFAFNYLVQEEFVIRDQIKSHNIDLTPTEARILKKLQFTPHITSRYYKKGSKIDFKLQENKKTSSSAVSYTPAKSKPKAILDDWCKKNGLTVNYECGVLNMAGYHIQVKVPPYEYIGTGNGSSGVANQRACQDFINHLPKECKPQVSGNQKASVVLRDWCTMQGLKMFCNKTTTVPRKTKCVVRVQSFDFVGTGIERMRKDAEDTAAQVFLDHLMAEGMRQQESHEAVDDGCDSDVDILEEKVQLNEGANTLPKIDLSSITHLFKKANSSQCINVTPGYWIGSEEAGLQQFFDENNINAQYTLSTDPDCSEGCHVASMQFYVRRIGKSFSASSNGSTVTEAKAKCASLLLKQLILANLFDGLKQRKAIAPIKEPIELDVPDELVQSIIQLCTEFDVNTPELVSCKMCQLND